MRAVSLVLVAFLAGCGFTFERSSELIDRRIVAVQADPPELVANGGPLPASVNLKALVIDPKGGKPAAYEWRACLPGLGLDETTGRCDETQETTLVESGTKDVFDLSVSMPVPPQLALLMQGLEKKGIAASAYVTAMLKVEAPDDEKPKGAPLYAVKRVVVSPNLPQGRRPNQNPYLSALLIDGKPWDPSTPLKLKLGACDAKDLVDVVDNTGKEPKLTPVCGHKLEPAYDPAQDETYKVQTFDGKVEEIKERLRFDWFTDGGSFSRQGTEEPDAIGPQEYDPLSTKWQEPLTPPSGSVHVWVVVRDGRGGTSWEMRTIEFEQ